MIYFKKIRIWKLQPKIYKYIDTIMKRIIYMNRIKVIKKNKFKNVIFHFEDFILEINICFYGNVDQKYLIFLI